MHLSLIAFSFLVCIGSALAFAEQQPIKSELIIFASSSEELVQNSPQISSIKSGNEGSARVDIEECENLDPENSDLYINAEIINRCVTLQKRLKDELIAAQDEISQLMEQSSVEREAIEDLKNKL